MTYVQSAGVRLYVEAVGRGYPLLLHTGAGGDGQMWHAAGYVQALEGYRRIVMDHRGHGRSDRPRDPGAHRMECYVADVIAVLDGLGLAQAAFWGYSDGARVGIATAARHPQRLAALILQGGLDDPADDAARARARDGRAALAHALRTQGMPSVITAIEQDEALSLPPWLRQNFMDTEAEMFALEVLGWRTWEGPWPLLPTIGVPTLVINGAHEDDGAAARAVALMPRTRQVLLPGLGHVGGFLRSDLVLPLVRAFLDETLSPGPSA